VCLLRFIVWSFLKARLQFTLDQFNGATSLATAIRLTFAMLLAASATESRRAYKFLTASKIAIGESWIALRIRAGGSFVPAIILRSLLFAANAPNTLERTQ